MSTATFAEQAMSPDALETTPVTLVLAPRFPLAPLALCTESLRLANRELGRPAFSWTLVTVDGGPATSSSGVELPAAAALGDIAFAPIAIVLSSYEPEEACAPALLAWLRRQDRFGATIGCVDTGGFVLDRSGILRDRRVAVHPESRHAYAETFGDGLLSGRLFDAQDRVLSSAGGVATLDMMLALIARRFDDALADRIAHVLCYRRLEPEAEPAGGDGAIARIDKRLGRMVELMQSHLEHPLPLEALARMAHVDPSTARRLFLSAFQLSPGRYYLRLRLERARSLLANTALPIRDVAGMAGFANPAAFARAYKRRFGRAPSADRRPSAGA